MPSTHATRMLVSALLASVALAPACFGTSFADPCQDYCDYICECHAGEEGYDCEQCRTEYTSSDPALQDECETSLVDLQGEDQANGTGCESPVDDTGL
ncbi:MAG: hypothetical protein ACK4YP_21795 [Myxococcota bacterium]